MRVPWRHTGEALRGCVPPGIAPEARAGGVLGRESSSCSSLPLQLAPQTHHYGLLAEVGNKTRGAAQGTRGLRN